MDGATRVHVRDGGARCPYCHDRCDADEPTVVVCQDCLARHHGECWSERATCASCSSARALVPPGGQAPAPARPAPVGLERLPDGWRERLLADLEPGEQVLYVGRPDPAAHAAAGQHGAAVLGLVGAGGASALATLALVAVVAVATSTSLGAGATAALLVAGVALALCLAAGGVAFMVHLVRAARRQGEADAGHLAHVITDRRVLAWRADDPTATRALGRELLGDAVRRAHEAKSGAGTLVFTRRIEPGAAAVLAHGDAGLAAARDQPVHEVAGLPDVRAAEERARWLLERDARPSKAGGV